MSAARIACPLGYETGPTVLLMFYAATDPEVSIVYCRMFASLPLLY